MKQITFFQEPKHKGDDIVTCVIVDEHQNKSVLYVPLLSLIDIVKYNL